VSEPIRLVHVFSSDLGIEVSIPFVLPLVARGWHITFMTPPGPKTTLPAAHGMRWLPLNLDRRIDLGGDARGTLELFRRLRGDRYHIVHTHNIKVGLISRVVAAAARSPIVVHTMHGLAYSLDTPWAQRLLHATFEKLASLRVDAILSQNEEDKRTIVETGVIDPGRIVTIGNGIDLARFHQGDEAREATRARLGIREYEVLFLSAGRLVREKGYLELFEAAVRARHADRRVRLAVAGRLDEVKADALPKSTLDHARESGVMLLGECADMAPLYAAADVVVLASWREGLPRVLVEGAAMGKPLIASDARGCREVVRPPANGLLARVRDPASLADAMLRMAADGELRARLGAANALEARERYDLRKVVARVVDVYDDLLARKHLAP
jgi:glycosyltransferase involved in cell wall biosynthesis